MHAGEEGVPAGGAALLGVVIGEHRTLIADAIDVGCLSGHQATMINPRLHPADVIAHDEDDVGLLSRSLGLSLCRPKPGPQRSGGKQHSRGEPAQLVFHCLTLHCHLRSHCAGCTPDVRRKNSQRRFLLFSVCAVNVKLQQGTATPHWTLVQYAMHVCVLQRNLLATPNLETA